MDGWILSASRRERGFHSDLWMRLRRFGLSVEAAGKAVIVLVWFVYKIKQATFPHYDAS